MKLFIYLFIYFILVNQCVADTNGSGGIQMNDHRLNEFKSAIGYQDAINKEPIVMVREVKLPDLNEIEPLNGWVLSDLYTYRDDTNGEIILSGRLTSPTGDDDIRKRPSIFFDFEQIVSHNGYTVIREHFLIEASSTSMVYIPYIRGPENLGTISAMSPKSESPKKVLFWIYRNILVKMTVSNMSDDQVYEIARWIQNDIETRFEEVQK